MGKWMWKRKGVMREASSGWTMSRNRVIRVVQLVRRSGSRNAKIGVGPDAKS